MADIKYYDVILKPVITERTMGNMSIQVDKFKKEVAEEAGKKVLKTVRDKAGKAVIETVEIKKYTFLVHPDATKSQIREAVEKMFNGVKVEKVNTMNYEGKEKRKGRTVGRTSKKKKAIVTLTQDSKDIELFAQQ